ncbi:hypothetical protein [Intrasporangium mesophilum]
MRAYPRPRAHGIRPAWRRCPAPDARSTRRRLTRAAAALAAALVVALPALAAGSALAASDDPFVTESALTKGGKGRFADLSVTVGKTTNLTDEAVKVSWKWGGSDPGSHATQSDTQWSYNYLSIFQCWGDDPSGPSREQCQYGGQFSLIDGINTRVTPFNNDERAYAVSRVVSPVNVFGQAVTLSTDPAETADTVHGYPATSVNGRLTAGIVPMRASPTTTFPDGEVDTDSVTSKFFDRFGTNEVPLARTNGDGTGSVFFETQTTYESQFLGCGARQPAPGTAIGVKGRGCWLVVVPRDRIDSNGDDVVTRPGGSERVLYSSPLSLSNWANRITFPLDFLPVREPCALGGVERPVVGQESLSVAMSSWQIPLCAGGQGYFYATTTDDIARATARTDLPKLSIATDPLAPDTIPPEEGKVVYAPVAVSGMTISVFIERAYNSASRPELRPFGGTRVEHLKLNQRLVAKLLTESYRYSTWITGGGPAHLDKAPLSLIDDPEFKALNATSILSDDVTEIRNDRRELARIYVAPDASDGVKELWEWILGDADARAFLDGKPDEWGMTVNSYYQGLSRYESAGDVLSNIPRLEEACTDVAIGNGSGSTQRLCALDAAPYVNSLDQAAALTSRGQPSGSESFVDDVGNIKQAKPEPQLVGQRALIALTDTPSAARRGLVSASLRNKDGAYVTPTSDAMRAALAQAVATRTTGVNRIDPTSVKGAGYPLTRLSYAMTNPARLDAQARKDYANFLDVVATDGQRPGIEPGDLPAGYTPLTGPYQVQAVNAAQAIRTAKALTPPASEPPASPPSGSPATDGPTPNGGPPSPITPPGDDGAPPVAAPPVAAPAVPGAVPPAAPAAPAAPSTGPLAFTRSVLDALSPALLPVLAAVGLLAGGAGRVMVWRANGGRRDA